MVIYNHNSLDYFQDGSGVELFEFNEDLSPKSGNDNRYIIQENDTITYTNGVFDKLVIIGDENNHNELYLYIDDYQYIKKWSLSFFISYYDIDDFAIYIPDYKKEQYLSIEVNKIDLILDFINDNNYITLYESTDENEKEPLINAELTHITISCDGIYLYFFKNGKLLFKTTYIIGILGGLELKEQMATKYGIDTDELIDIIITGKKIQLDQLRIFNKKLSEIEINDIIREDNISSFEVSTNLISQYPQNENDIITYNYSGIFYDYNIITTSYSVSFVDFIIPTSVETDYKPKIVEVI